MIDVETKQMLSFEITEEDVPDDDMFFPLLNPKLKIFVERKGSTKPLEMGLRIKIFNELEKRGSQSGSKMRKDAATKSRGSP